jgi:hypothetical protein
MERKNKGGRSTDNPKQDRKTVRLDKATLEILNAYCDKYKVTSNEAIRIAINLLKDK